MMASGAWPGGCPITLNAGPACEGQVFGIMGERTGASGTTDSPFGEGLSGGTWANRAIHRPPSRSRSALV